MRKMLRNLLILAGVFSVTTLQAQDHLLISEFAMSPTAGEFIEIYNPTGDTVSLSDVYLTDATFAGGGGTYYYQIVTGGGGGGGFGDFNARFPDGASIAPGEYQTISLNGSDNFTATYGVAPTYELFEDGGAADGIPDMREAVTGSINGQGGLSNNGEFIALYYWDGASDLVKDLDYVVWGDKNEAVDKTGVVIDGPDADTTGTMYANDTAIDDQTIVDTENDGDPNPHDDGMSAQRKLPVEDLEVWSGGNGMTGHDETGENTSWKGGIWSLNQPATPGWRALGDSLNIADVQFIRADSIGAGVNEDSPVLNDTVSVTGIVTHSMREVFLGSRYGGFILDERGGPWSGYFLIQNDSTVSGTQVAAALPGDLIKVTGIIGEFPNNPNTQSITQGIIITDPVTPIEFIDFGRTIPDTILLTPSDLGATGSSEDPMLTERWESTLVRFEDLTVLSNFAGQGGNVMTAGNDDGTISLDDYFLGIRTTVTNNGGEWPGFPTGTKINVTGYVRDVLTGGQGRTTINPRTLADIEIASSPPSITNVARDPVAAVSTAPVTVSATITDAQTTVASASVEYRVDGGAFQSVAMTDNGGTWSGGIPAQSDGAFIEYFLKAADDTGAETTVPGDTSAAKLFYFVRDGGLTIFDVQFTPFADGNTPYSGLEVTVEGVVVTDTTDFSFYYIQEGTDPWNGVFINDNVNQVSPGDRVRVTGTAQENFNLTRITNVTNVEIVSTGNAVPDPIVLTTGELGTGAAETEKWESMLVRLENVEVSNPFSDSPSNFGEFTIDDGSGGYRVDDLGNFRGNLDSTYGMGDRMNITGLHYFSFGNYKLVPRNTADVELLSTSVDEDGILPMAFDLEQNYPNPFNPSTNIRYQIANAGDVQISIFNLLGQKVRTLVDQQQAAGRYEVRWDGNSDAGIRAASGVYFYKMIASDFVKIQKMVLMK